MVIITRSKDVKPEDMGDDDWSAGTYEEILNKYDAEKIEDYPPVHAVDLLSIATQSDPVPLKDVSENLLDQYDGVYLGDSPLVKTLQDDKFFFNVNGVQRKIEASRWMMLDVDQSWRSSHNDKLMQYYQKHGHAVIKIPPNKACTPSIDYEKRPILAVRTYTGAYAGVINLAFYWQQGTHRCNILQDSELGAAVYCYPDMKTVIEKLELSKSWDRTMCLALVEGYLHKSQNKKNRISLDSRSCRLLKVFAPFCTEIEVPRNIAMEDSLSLRLDPFNLGAPLLWFREICNMKDVTPSKLQRLNRNPEEWNGNTIPQELFEEMYEIAAYDPTSRNKKDMEEQKWLYIELHECTKGYDKLGLTPGRFLDQHPAWKHPDKIHNMLKFLRQAVREIDEGDGWWSTWYDPDPLAEPAKDLAMNRMPRKENAKTSEVRIEVDEDQFSKLQLRSKADRERSQVARYEKRQDSLSDSSGSWTKRRREVILKRAEQDQAYEERIEQEVRRIENEKYQRMLENEREVREIEAERYQRMLEICDRDILPKPPSPPKESRKDEVEYKGDYYYQRNYAERFPAKGAGSSTDQPRGRRNYQRSYPNPPLSPKSIQRAARWVEENEPRKLEVMIASRKFLEYKDGKKYLYAEGILKNLRLRPLYYCPILRSKSNGQYIYEQVTEYSSKWLPKTRKGVWKNTFDYQAINPVEIWQEDPWTFVRRMLGYVLVQKLFYEFMTRTWIMLDIDKGRELRNYQDTLIDNIFGHRSIDYFVKNQKTDTIVTTFDGEFTGYLAYDELERLGRQICVLGPIAGVFGRQLEQWLISPNRKLYEEYIPVEVIQRSIDESPCALKSSWLRDTPILEAWSKNNNKWDDECSDYDTQVMEKRTKMQRRSLGSDRYWE